MKKILFLLFFIFACLSLTACGSDTPGEDGGNISSPPGSISYSKEHMLITEAGEIESLWVSGGRINYYFHTRVQDTLHLVVASILPDGTDRRYINIPLPVLDRQIYAVNLNAQGNVETLAREVNEIVFTVYDTDGALLSRLSFGDLSVGDDSSMYIRYAHFSENGIVIFPIITSIGSTTIYVADTVNGTHTSDHYSDRAIGISTLKDGRVIIAFEPHNQSGHGFRIFDNETGLFDDFHQSYISNLSHMVPVQSDSPFDIIFSNNSTLFGYCMETKKQTVILNWIETGFSIEHKAIIDTLLDDHFLLFTGSRQKDGMWEADIYFLTPGDEIEEDDRIPIIIGGLWIGGYNDVILKFNEESQTHKIVIYDYLENADSYEAAVLRLRTDLIAGKGPDIIVNVSPEIMNHGGMLADLYPFIDADSELDRSDFFPNALKILEDGNGALVIVMNYFQIDTMIGKTEDVEHITSWTPQTLLEILNNPGELKDVLGPRMDGEYFVRVMIGRSGDEFINWGTKTANLNTDAFIKILEAAHRLNEMRAADSGNDDFEYYEFTRMHRKEQLLSTTMISGIASYQWYVTGLRDFTVLGYPTSDGGRNTFSRAEMGIGMNNSSQHKEQVWLFLREFFLPSAYPDYTINNLDTVDRATGDHHFSCLPLRIDVFDKILDISMTPLLENGIDVPRSFTTVIYGGVQENIPNYAISEETADEFRQLVESAEPSGLWIGNDIWDHVRDDLNAFFTGGRSAADTARIIQNRMQTYLDEIG